MIMEGQQFCLRWHNFQNTLLSSLPKLLDGGYLTDVTLSAGGRHIHAHRLILSACSYYFKELFKDLNTLQHPVIILPGMEYANLCALVTFMYNGEVNIYQEQLPALLAMADTLHVRGLADIAGKASRYENNPTVDPPSSLEEKNFHLVEKFESSTKTDPKEHEEILTPEPHEAMEPIATDFPAERVERNLEIESESNNVSELNDLPCSVKTKPYYSINAKLNQREKKSNFKIDSGHSSNILKDDCQSPLLENVKPLLTDTNFKSFLSGSTTSRASQSCNKTSVTCLICGKQLSNQYNLRVHMETHSNSSYSCAACSHVSRSRDALRKHVSYRHPVNSAQKKARYSSSKP
ncbi:PREDICTED: zinc finger protein 131-like isoform X2 [Ceratosolen solmsi marchali]|uniref:Zinc finger protein 131-like isoform X2 n=1 Tax=Ceratosolen solmsi marchali TaxID=326594 RepID=A0AAJ7E3C5_9HYME|nr:PREDICTED: zinc finger protein 131-like isoform X2 [Ceratosolen solmsi marchali]